MVRVLLAIESESVRRRLRTLIEQEPDAEVVGEATEPVDLLVHVSETRADVVIQTWPESGEMPGICSVLLMECPELLVIGVPPREDRSFVCRQTITRATRETTGLEDILNEIRRAVPVLE